MVINGDFNIDILPENTTMLNLVERMFLKGCENLIEEPTRVTLTSKTVIELGFTNFAKHLTFSGVLASGISDHLPIFAVLHVHNHVQNATTTV